jgi:hypothetical protein
MRRWTVAWLGAALLGVFNGATRELAYKDRLGDTRANQASVATLVALLAFYFSSLQRRWPIGSTQEAASIGATWSC